MLANSQVEKKTDHLMIINTTANKILKALPGKIYTCIRFDNLFSFLLTSVKSTPPKILQNNKMSLNKILNDLSSEPLAKGIITPNPFYYNVLNFAVDSSQWYLQGSRPTEKSHNVRESFCTIPKWSTKMSCSL